MRRSFSLFLLLVLVLAACAPQSNGSSNSTPTDQPTAQSIQSPGTPFDLSGIWITDAQEEVEITHLTATGLVVALFSAPNSNERAAGDCDTTKFASGHRDKFIDARLQGITLAGKMTGCEFQEPVKLCNFPHVAETTFTATVVSSTFITGTSDAHMYDKASCAIDPKPIPLSFTLKRKATPAITLTAPPSTNGGICQGQERVKEPKDDQALDQVLDGLSKAYLQVKDELDQAKLLPPSDSKIALIKDLYEKLNHISEFTGHLWTLRHASCVPPALMQALVMKLNGQEGACNNIASETEKWFSEMKYIPDTDAAREETILSITYICDHYK